LQPIKEDKVFESEQSSSKTVVKRTKSFTVLNKPATIDKRASLMSTNKIIKNNSNQNTDVIGSNEKIGKSNPIKTSNESLESEQSSSKTVVKRTKSFTVLNKPATIDFSSL
jgi:hypothetical protein